MKLLSTKTIRLDTTALRKMSLSSALFLLAGFISCVGQGTIQVGFDGSPLIAQGTAKIVQQYYDSGMLFTPIDPNASFAGFCRRKGGGVPPSDWPDNGTAYLQAGVGSSLKFNRVNNSLFGIYSVDLAGYSHILPDFVLYFVGYRPDGSSVTTSFSGSGLNFQTFYFPPEFSGLSRVEVPVVRWSLDNLVIAVPEPASGALLACGAFAAMLLRKKRRTG